MTTELQETWNWSWKQIQPLDDPVHGKPCSRSSHGVSLLQNNDNNIGRRLVIHGGEHVARTPLFADHQEEEQNTENNNKHGMTWVAEETSPGGPWTWRRVMVKKNGAKDVPPPRVAHAQAVHQPSQSVFIFGGRAGITMNEQAMNDLWKLDCSGPPGSETWTCLFEGSSSATAAVDANENNNNVPEARSFHRMECIGDTLYVFGGCSAHHGRLADVHAFDIKSQTWKNYGASSLLKGRGGANWIPLAQGTQLAAIAGFIGEESNDGHIFELSSSATWKESCSLTQDLEGLRPRSVCISKAFAEIGLVVIFGGEVDPSQKGHEGAGGFANDIVILEESTGKYCGSIPPAAERSDWPGARGWSDGDGIVVDDKKAQLYFFGGLTGDDTNPRRLDDLWCLTMERK